MRAALALLLLMVAASPLGAQRIALRAGYALADYREQADFLHFGGHGPAAGIAVERGRLGLRVDVVRLDLKPTEAEAGLQAFTLDQVDARLAVQVVSLLALEAGYIHRDIEPSHAAQSFSAARLGVRAAYPLAPGASVGLRTAYLAGGDFTGGGRAPFAIEVGLSAAYGPGHGRIQVTGDYEFQRIDRRTGSGGQALRVPIESSIARVGVGVTF